MKLRVRLFAVARELAGADEISVEVPDGASAGDVRRALAGAEPALAPILPQVLLTVNSEYVSDNATIPPQSEVACIPPVSGG